MNLPIEQIVALLGVVAGYVGRMFTKEAMLEAKIDQLQKDVTAAHVKLREVGKNADR